ncbi:MAG: NFACT family protein [Chloroflexi bacterium]|nr:NFACT family protein [Chloroflexota bacterium]
MPFDALALHAVHAELRARVLDGRVQKVLLIDEQTVALELYAHRERHWLLATARPDSARVHLLRVPPARETAQVTPLLLLLRKHVRGARLAALHQPPLERVLELRFLHRDERGQPYGVSLVLEVMGRRSNFVLVDQDGTILDALKRVPPQLNPARPLLPHLRYTPPPRGEWLDPRQAASYAVLEPRAAAEHGSRSLAQFLAAHLAGLSPLAAEELAYRATGQRRAPLATPLPWSALLAAARELFAPLDTGQWEPHLILRDDQPIDVTPYRPRQFPPAALRPVPSISEAFEILYASPRPPVRHALQRAPLLQAIAARREQEERRRSALQRALAEAANADALRTAGEAILAELHAIAPGQTTLTFAGRTIALDPARSPLENAQAYFEAYTRARDAMRVVPGVIEEVELELRYLAEMQAQVELADDSATLEQLRRELVAHGLLAPNKADTKRGRAAPRGGIRRLQLDGYEVLVGTSAVGNERVTFELAGPDDLWLHARGVPGSHVIVRSAGRPLPPAVLEAAARLAAAHSAARTESQALVDYTARKHVRRIPNAPPGLVTYRHEQTIRVRPGGDES